MAEKLLAKNLFSLKGKVSLITGGGTGLGKMISKAFIMNGAKVYIASRKQRNLEEAAAELNSLGGSECIPIKADVSIKEECEKISNEINRRENGKLDILINNAGIAFGAPLTKITEDIWDKSHKLNVASVYHMTMACLPLLEKASHAPEDPSRVIVMGSISGLSEGDLKGIVGKFYNTSLAYNCTKAAVHSLAMNLAVYLTPRGVNVNVMAPGVILTPMTSHQDQKLSISEVPQGRLGDEADIAGTALYLASRAGAWLTGSVIKLDGGTILRNKELAKDFAIAAKS
ncbi:10885_t:CDS:2 [Funneliformis caledonium]|uniref:10885_t:CDS:1 n=1 Tax=Funneliformis caledonium TaxID=1117310 RepID=A0A9N9HKG2_9GLOM|nr:10885_t:CDS:2 [Funneliformis caledonium]